MHKAGALLAVFASWLSAAGPTPAYGEIPGYVVLPLTIIAHSNQAALRVNLNGQSIMLMLDTGASVSALDSHFYNGVRAKAGGSDTDKLPPELRKTVHANGEAAQIGYIDSMQAGAMNFGKGPALVIDLSQMVGSYNNYHHTGAIAGMLGEDILHHFSAIIDWRRRGVYWNTDPSKRLKLGPGLVSSGWTAVPMAPTNSHRFTVSCTVSGKPVRLLVDTGAGFTSFSPGIVPLDIIYNRDTGPSMSRISSTGGVSNMIGLDSIVHPARLEHWKIGSYEVASSSVAVHKFPPGVLDEQSSGEGPMLGLLGAEILAANNAIIDIAGSTLYLKPSSNGH